MVRLERAIGERPDRPLGRRWPPRPGRSAGSRLDAGRTRRGHDDLVAERRLRGAGAGDLGQRPQAAWVRRDRRELGLAVGDPIGLRRGGDVAGRRRGRAGRQATSPGTTPPRAGTRRTRTARSAGRPRRRSSRAAPDRPRRGPSARGARPRAAFARRSMCHGGTTTSSAPWASRTGPAISGDGIGRTDLADDVAAWPDVDVGREPGERVGDDVRERQAGEAERLAGQAVRIGRRRGRDHRRDAVVGGRREDGPDPAHRVPGDRPDRHLRPGQQGLEGRQRVVRRTRRR